jgi:hypothetical protein
MAEKKENNVFFVYISLFLPIANRAEIIKMIAARQINPRDSAVK